MVKNIFALENDVLEKAMADFYAYYVSGDCCENDKESCLSLNTLYEYAGFFTNTFAGRSYLFRRKSAIRCLMDYYAVLILDRANEAGINRYGIDIRPQIDLALDNIVNRNNLVFQDQYLKKINRLTGKIPRLIRFFLLNSPLIFGEKQKIRWHGNTVLRSNDLFEMPHSYCMLQWKDKL